jgi:alkylation response protein AidB-like acyl-CoA dehydrogenase
VDLRPSPEDNEFRTEVRTWLEENLVGDFADARGLGGPGFEHEGFEIRHAWEKHLARAGWTCVGWPKEHGGAGLTLPQQVIFYEEYALARAPARVGIVGEGLLGPAMIAYGSEEQQKRYLPPIVSGDELWCQGFSEPDAGSDLANVQARAVRDGDHWVVNGQKTWTSLAHWSDWIFILCRTDFEAPRHRSLSYMFSPMDAEGIEARPIRQMTGDEEFSEVFFSDVRIPVENVVGEVNAGWQVALGTLASERGASTLGLQVGFRNKLSALIDWAVAHGATEKPGIRDRLAQAWIGLEIMRFNAMRALSSIEQGKEGPEASFVKLYWANWHRDLGNLAMDVMGTDATVAAGPDYDLTAMQRTFLFSRADTIHSGSNQIQRNVIGERVLGLPREPRP